MKTSLKELGASQVHHTTLKPTLKYPQYNRCQGRFQYNYSKPIWKNEIN